MEPLYLDSINTSLVYDPPEPENRIYAREMGYPRTAAQAVVHHVSAVTGQEYKAQGECLITELGTSLRAALTPFIKPTRKKPTEDEEIGEVILMDPSSPTLKTTVKAAEGNPVFVPLIFRPGQTWAVDYQAFSKCITINTKAMILQSPSPPSGALLSKQDWAFIARLCLARNLLLIYETSFDTVMYHSPRPKLIHPASFPGMKNRTLIIGTGSGLLGRKLEAFEYVVGPECLISKVSSLVQSKAGLTCCEVTSFRMAERRLMQIISERRAMAVHMLSGLPIGIPAGGWSLLLRVNDYGLTAQEATWRLAMQGVNVTPMDGWGDLYANYFVRIVFAHEPVHRLALLRARVFKALTV